jgi:protein O-GlcNAc transferase
MAEIPASPSSAVTIEQGLTQALESALQLAINYHQSGNLEDAETLYRSILEVDPNHPEANHNLGVVAAQMGQTSAALPFLTTALQADPTQERYWLSYIEALLLTGETDAAREALTLAQQQGLQGPNIDALAKRMQEGGQTEIEPGPGWTIMKHAQPMAARRPVARTGPSVPRPAKIASPRTGGRQPPLKELQAVLAHFEAGKYTEAEKMARSLVKRFPRHGYSWKALALSLLEQGRASDALDPMKKAETLLPDDPEVHNGLGLGFYKLGHYLEAEASFRKVIQIRPDFIDAYRNLGPVLGGLGRLEEAEAVLRTALAAGQMNMHQAANLHNNLGKVLQLHGRYAEAEAVLRHALEIKPNHISARSNIAIALKSQLRLVEAEANLRRVLESNPDEADTLNTLGAVLIEQGRHEEAETALRRALRLLPQFREARNNLLYLLNYHPDKPAEDIFAVYRDYDELLGLPHKRAWRKHDNARDEARRLKVGYVSPDFRHHPVQHFLEPLLAHHDKQAVEVYLYAEIAREDEVTERYRKYADHWIPTMGRSDNALAERIRADGIDVLVDLAGHTLGNRLQTFARKPAPVSMSWLGHHYTTGLSAIDYFLTDDASSPEGSEQLFAETLWRLPTPAHVYRPAQSMPPVSDQPALQRGGVTFGTMAHAIRINHHTIRVWSELLKRVPGSRLVIDSSSFKDAETQDKLAERFAGHGIGGERLEIGYHSAPWDIMQQFDIGLDCFPHNAWTTLFETLYMGIPYVTLADRPGVGRMGGAILEGLGHPEWIARSEEEYIEKAAALAADLPALAALRARLRTEMEGSPLMDEAGFARKVEQVYREMWIRWCRDVQDH